MFRYKITSSSSKPIVDYDTIVSKENGWTDLPENGEIVGEKGNVVTVVAMTTIGAKARAKGEAVLPAPTSSN